MPATVNGLGTTYYGKKDCRIEKGQCEFCNKVGDLATYETRLWFVVFFIPVIPLGKKQVIRLCPGCKRHRVASLKEWNRLKEASIAEAMAETRSKPADPAATTKLHDTLMAFGKWKEADELASILEKQCADNAAVQMHLGSGYERRGRNANADRCFERALNAEPENRFVRRAVAIGCIQRGDLPRARDLLSCMEEPGPHQEPGALFLLAIAYRSKGQNEEALSVFQTIARCFPRLAETDKKLRKEIARAEKALGQRQTILPKRRIAYWKAAIAGGLAASVVVGALGWNWHLACNQTLHVVNGFEVPVKVGLPGPGELMIQAGRREEVKLAEGEYTVSVQVGEEPAETVVLTLKNSFFERFSSESVFILNAGGGAVLVWQEMTYSASPQRDGQVPYRLYTGDRFLALRRISYAFRAPPEKLQGEHGATLRKRQVDLVSGEPEQLVSALAEAHVPPEEILSYAEAHLQASPENESLMQVYLALCAGSGNVPRCGDFLARGIRRRPVLVEWHRAYQGARTMCGRDAELLTEYDTVLKADPVNSALLYLRGRIAQGKAEAFSYYDRAISADSRNPYPLFAKAYHIAAKGDFAGARDLCASACRLKPDSKPMQALFYDVRFALGEYSALEKESLHAQRGNPLDLTQLNRLLETRIAQGNPEGAQDAVEAYQQALRKQMPDDPYELRSVTRLQLAYVRGDLVAWAKEAESLRNPQLRKSVGYQVALEQGDMPRVEEALSQEKGLNGSTCLLVWLGWRERANTKKASEWLEKAQRGFLESSSEERVVGTWLQGREQAIAARLDDLALSAQEKAVLWTAFAELYPQQRAELLARAETMNFSPGFPHRFLERTIQAMRAGAP